MELYCLWHTPYKCFASNKSHQWAHAHTQLRHRHAPTWTQLLSSLATGDPTDLIIFEEYHPAVAPEDHPLQLMWTPRPLVLYLSAHLARLPEWFEWPIDEVLPAQTPREKLLEAVDRLLLQRQERHPRAAWEGQSLPLCIHPISEKVHFQPVGEIHYILRTQGDIVMRTDRGVYRLAHAWTELQGWLKPFPQFTEVPGGMLLNLHQVDHLHLKTRELLFGRGEEAYSFKLTQTQVRDLKKKYY